MSCPQCGSSAKCLDSRPSSVPNSTRRRYRCDRKKCGIRWSTLEQVVGANVRGRHAAEILSTIHRKAALTTLREHIEKMIESCNGPGSERGEG